MVTHLRLRPAFIVLAVLSAVACSSSESGGTGAPAEPDASIVPDAGTPDAPGSPVDAEAEASVLPPVTGSLEAKAAGALATSIAVGPIALAGGSAQWRAKPSGGGVLTVLVVEGSPGARAFEITVYDDTASLDAAESFPADSTGSFALRKARVETYGAKGWRTNGDGTVKVTAISTASVTLELGNVGQFVQAPDTNDTWLLSGTITVPFALFPATTGASATLTPSNPQTEPGSGEALNLSSPASALTGPAKLGDESYPFTSPRRAASIADSARRVLIGFPTGHLPRQGQSISLSTFDRMTVTLVDGPTFTGDPSEKVWEADQGTAVVQSRTATSLVLVFSGARMQSESVAAKGTFELDGTVTLTLP